MKPNLNSEFKKLQKRSILKYRLSFIIGIFLGIKTCDYLFYDPSVLKIQS